MKVLFVSQYYLPHSHGGTELYIYNLCQQLKQLGITSAVCCSAPLMRTESYVHENITVYGSSSTSVLLQQVNDLVTREGYNILHIHTLGGNLDNLFLEQLGAVPAKVFLTPHLVDNFCLNRGKLLYKNSIPCNGFVSTVKCQSCITAAHPSIPPVYQTGLFQFVLQYLLPGRIAKIKFSDFHFLAAKMKKRIGIIRKTGVKLIPIAGWYTEVLALNNLPHLPFLRQAVSNPFLMVKPVKREAGFKWVFAGRLSEEKGVRELADAFATNALPGDELVLLIFLSKDPTLFEREMLTALKQQDGIVIHVNKEAEEVSALMKDCDCLVLPTKICEMAPLVLREAFSLHIPVLVSDFIREAIPPLQGLIFNYSIANDFGNQFLEMRKRGRTMKETGFDNYEPNDFRNVAEEHLVIYRKALTAS